RERDGKNSANEIMNKIIKSNTYVYEELYNRLSLSQRKALKIIAMEQEKLFSEAVIRQYNMKSSQLLNKALNALEEKGMLDKNGTYQFNDPLFKIFVRMV
ncbi:MAG: winged helix DNA-binding protein, partial [Nanoarchaeota archaeon]